MASDQQQQIKRLWKLQDTTRKTVQDIAEHMGQIAATGVVLSQDRWDKLFASWEDANKRMQEIGEALNKLRDR